MTRLSSDFYAISPLYPSDRVAARVAGRGEHFDFKNELSGKVHSDLPLSMRPPHPGETSQPSFRDLTGTVIGRLRVMGIAELVTGAGTNWVVRCICGSYETRKAKYIKRCVAGNNPGKEEPMCDWCAKTRKLQMGIGVVRDGPLVKPEDL